eukprot:1173134-Prorocentrum_minimum.AAC.2
MGDLVKVISGSSLSSAAPVGALLELFRRPHVLYGRTFIDATIPPVVFNNDGHLDRADCEGAPNCSTQGDTNAPRGSQVPRTSTTGAADDKEDPEITSTSLLETPVA